MKRWTFRSIALIAAAMLLTTPGLLAQGKGAGGGQRGTGAQAGQPGQSAGRQQGKMGSQKGQGDMDRDRDRDRLRTHVTDQQRDQFRACGQAMEQLQAQSREMVRLSGDKSFNKEAALQHQEQMRERFRSMQQEHERLMQGLNAEQKAAVQQRNRQMEQLQQRVANRLNNVDQELGKSNPSASRVREQARNMEREMDRLHNHFRTMGEDLAFD